MKNMTSCKRVSFGNKGSMVETLIIEEIPCLAEQDVGLHNNNNVFKSPENCIKAKSQSDCRHVTIVITDTSEDQHSSTSGDSPFHPVEERPGSPSGTEGSWPLKRSQSIDSRDNPFLPGGNLSKEADEILSKAKIIRDTFILTDAEVASGGTTSDSSTRSPPKTKNVQAHSPSSPTKGNARSKTALNGNNYFSNNSTTPVCETMAQNEVSKTESSVVQNASSSPSKTRTNENGQLDSEKTLTPRSVGTPEEEPEKKKHNKCCAVM
ncbi:uncharacterized protein LOC127874082 isoform X2 [Dreissena polymorpha]|uniref:uncharacterized protein LOC127874082 isoform X2 n=2 Tax=Dreissena polymorpha TaxID=45954 RepID=UPI0022648333|nr:uncharacterized protein LOC127874082 isoform X2 [Dreissena polymorpha]